MRRIITAALAATTLAAAALATAGTASAQPYWRPYYHHWGYGPYAYWGGPRPYWGGYYGPGWGWRHHYWRRW